MFLGLTPLMAWIGPDHKKDIAPADNSNIEDIRLGLRAPCPASNEQTIMEVNNVRVTLLVGGDVWWNKTDGRYVVPKPPVGSSTEEVSSIFAGGVWLGGLDPSGNLKVAASDYPTGNTTDYYPGPLDPETGATDDIICNQWADFFKVQGDAVRKVVRDYDNAIASGLEFEADSIPDDVLFWPGQGNVNFFNKFGFDLPDNGAGLGSFWDNNSDGVYSPIQGDFPTIDIRGCEPETRKEARELIPDEMIFWIYNDAGDIHRLSRADNINMEVQVQAFAYATNDEINDMTFMRYKLINRAKDDIRNTYFGMWADPDLGCSIDDYSGSDVGRGLAYTYNQDAIDGEGTGDNCTGGVPTYGSTIPLVGTDYFRGPTAPKVIDDSNGDLHTVSIADVYSPFLGIEVGDTVFIRNPQIDPSTGLFEDTDFNVELGMSSFMYYNRNTGGVDINTTDPSLPEHYYNYLRARWLNDEPLTVGGTGFNAGSVDTTSFAFPDPPANPDGWSMAAETLGAGDRRTLQTSGPFLLKPGAVNELIVGVVWVPDVRHPEPALTKLTTADDIAQGLFDNCFDIIDGPDAPTVCPIALDQEIILVLHNDTLESNNAREAYSEVDILAGDDIPDSLKTYLFEGYIIYQLVDETVSPQEFRNIERARIVGQVDIKNGISTLYNWESTIDPNPLLTPQDAILWFPVNQIDGNDTGIENTFRLTNSAFDNGGRLLNHTRYYYAAVAYAHNNYETFNPNDPSLTQQNPYLEGRGNISTYEVIPRPNVYTGLNAAYGDGVPVRRLSGAGNGGNVLDMEESMYDEILSGTNDGTVRYKSGAGPIAIKIYNPLEVQDGRFKLEIVGEHFEQPFCELETEATWLLTNVDTGEEIASDRTIEALNEQIIAEFGFSISIVQTPEVGSKIDNSNGALSARIEYADPSGSAWFDGIRDNGAGLVQREGIERPGANFFFTQIFDYMHTGDDFEDANLDLDPDPTRSFSNLGDGYWTPFMLASADNGVYLTPSWIDGQRTVIPSNGSPIRNLNNVDIVFTSDKSKWSRCVVVETNTDDFTFGETKIFDDGLVSTGNPLSLDLREMPSIDKDGNAAIPESGSSDNENDANYNSDFGLSWFPGYAVDVETGNRLNIFFGENSRFNETSVDILIEEDIEDIGRNCGCNLTRGDNEPVTPPDQSEENDIHINTETGEIFTIILEDRISNGDTMQVKVWTRTDDELDLQLTTDTNGNDMKYNPTSTLFRDNDIRPNLTGGLDNLDPISAGGQHYIYVTREEYDGCQGILERWNRPGQEFRSKIDIYRSVTWTAMSYVAPGEEILSYADGVVPNDVTMKLRVDNPYNLETQFRLRASTDECNLVEGQPIYEFDIVGLQAEELTSVELETALDDVKVVPNPYFANSAYETSQRDKRVKITNVPNTATVTIYSLDGKFVKRFNRAEEVVRRGGANPGVRFSQVQPDIEWDLENGAGIPIASGVYLIHVVDESTGFEKTIKWFGVSRKFDPTGL